ncbi:unnamed protein product, partial [Mesorhabditis belari]|uniref:Poly A polymerase head domain-containing protein n=1 Tax=Mesorhabditis belari TaxID=2138241 RepID=A0AAF3FI37_9BILA
MSQLWMPIGFLIFNIAIIKCDKLCGQLTEVNKTEINLPKTLTHIWNPWRIYPKAKVYRGEKLTNAWNFVKIHQVRGLNDTIEEMKAFMDLNGCFFIIQGGAVRDLVLSKFPRDIDGRVTCDMKFLQHLCNGRYGRDNCHKSSSQSVNLQIGNGGDEENGSIMFEAVDVVHWNESYEVNATGLEFTINSLSLYEDPVTKEIYLIDLLNGLQDVCERKIRITARRNQWKTWASARFHKVYRFMKSESSGFIPADEQNRQFIVRLVKNTFDLHRLDFKRSFCHNFLFGYFSYEQDLCFYHRPLVDERKYKLEKYIKQLRNDFDQDFYENKLKKTIDEIYSVDQ